MALELDLVLFMVTCGAIGFIWAEYLTSPESLFGWVPKVTQSWPKRLQKVIHECAVCLSGQLAFWGYVVLYFQDYSLLMHLFAAFVTMLFVSILMRYV